MLVAVLELGRSDALALLRHGPDGSVPQLMRGPHPTNGERQERPLVGHPRRKPTRPREVGRGERVLSGAWRLRLPLDLPGVPHCNAWALRAGDGIVLVDTGMHDRGSMANLERALDQSGHRIEDVKLVVVTHAHIDHCGQAPPIAERAGCEVWMHPHWAIHAPGTTTLDETIAHVRSRSLFGGPMSALPGVQARVAEMATDVEAAALLVYRAAWTKDAGAERVTKEAAMAKAFATEAAGRVIDAAAQLHGGRGVTSGHIVERLTRDIRPLRIYEGATEVLGLVVGRAIVGGG